MQHGLKKSRGFVALWNSKERINLTFSMRSTLVLPNEILTHWNNSVVNASPVDAMFPNLPDNNLLKTGKCKHSYRTWCPYPKRFHAKKIKPKQFTPGEKTIIRFTREGVKVCSNFVEKYCHKFNPKSVLIHVGTRDIHNSNVKSEKSQIFESCVQQYGHTPKYTYYQSYTKKILMLSKWIRQMLRSMLLVANTQTLLLQTHSNQQKTCTMIISTWNLEKAYQPL